MPADDVLAYRFRLPADEHRVASLVYDPLNGLVTLVLAGPPAPLTLPLAELIEALPQLGILPEGRHTQ